MTSTGRPKGSGDTDELPGEPTLVTGRPPPNMDDKAAVRDAALKTGDAARATLSREEGGKEQDESTDPLILADVHNEIKKLRDFRTKGDYREGAEEGNQLYELVKARYPDDPDSPAEKDLLLMEIIDEAGWMQYALVEEGVGNFDKWRDRAEEIYNNLSALRKPVEEETGTPNYELRLKIVIAEVKMKLQRIRLEWKRGQLYEEGEAQHRTIDEALSLCGFLLNQDTQFRTEDPAAQLKHRVMVNAVRQSREYSEVIAETRRMKGVISGLMYVWHQDYQMKDHDAAERTLPASTDYAVMLQVAEGFMREYIGFQGTQAPAENSPKLRYAYLERIRHLKMLGQYQKALDFAHRVKKQSVKEGDDLYLSRLNNSIGELKMILAEKLLAAEPNSKERQELFGQALAVAGTSGIHDYALHEIDPERLAHLLLRHAFEEAAVASRAIDNPTARTAQQTLFDIGNSLIITGPRAGEADAFKSLMERISREMEIALLKFDDAQWFFMEAPLLARLWLAAEKQGLKLPFSQRIQQQAFRQARTKISFEIGRSQKKPKIPDEYCQLLRRKRDDIHSYLARSGGDRV